MANILHLAPWFDPSGDVTRSVAELNKFSKHHHDVVVRWMHPDRATFKFPEPLHQSPTLAVVRERMDWADAIIYHLVGKDCEAGYKLQPGSNKPIAFRNANVLWNGERFCCSQEFFDNPVKYKAIGSCHMGARDFMGEDCAFLPALIPINDELYTPDWTWRNPCVAYTKRTKEITGELSSDYRWIRRLDLSGQSWQSVMHMRRTQATVCIDAITGEGHYGLFGTESLAQGIPCVAHLERRTLEQLADLTDAGPVRGSFYCPFISADALRRAVLLASEWAWVREEYGDRARRWIEQYYNSQRLVERYWDPFMERLLV